MSSKSQSFTSPRQYRSGADVCKALGHPSRLLIVDALCGGEQCVSELTSLVGSDPSTVSNHLAVLRNAGLVTDDRRGQHVFYRLGAPCMTKMIHFLEEIREARETLR